MSALAEALVAAQAELPCAIGKDADGQIGQRSYRYLTLDKLIAETRPILQRHGVLITQCPTMMSNKETSGFVPALRTFVTHVEGESWSFAMPLYLTEKTMQGLGSAITYARRYRRKVASPKQWQAIIAAKGGPCRVCGGKPETNGHQHMTARITFHHLVPRSQGGDDVEDNIVPLCTYDHELVTLRESWAARTLAASLTDSEYAYVVGKLGESGPARLFGVER